ncbi:helix-turn-helix domain-containing protein [Escherichia coli]|nr:helix-turn-helix domain-containing protein [Escherichia coli]
MTITTDTTLLHDPRRQAALLYWQGFSVPQIAAMLQMKRPTVQSWKQRDGWDSVAPISRVEMSLEARLTQLIIKPQKTGGDFKEIDLLGRQIERLARVNRYSQTGNEADLKVASGMASQSHLRSTYFSTPSTLAHDAYPFWSGELFNRGRASAAERVEIDVSHNALAGGLLCADGQWRQIVTIEDALKGGCTLFDIEQLKRENSADDFKNLFMCEFVDDKASVFPFEELQRCMVDTLEEWEDYAPFAANPFGSRPVWIGYDPSHRGDSAGCVVLAPPVVAGGKFRILERHQWKGMDFATQAESIRKLTEKYNVEYIGIDATGLGVGVFQLVRSFYPAARDIRYTPEMKTAMVLKAKDVIRRGCLEYDVSATDITSSFMAIRKTMTSSGRSATYEASRSEEASHADLAWATMHALLNEPLTAGISTPLTSTILEFY